MEDFSLPRKRNDHYLYEAARWLALDTPTRHLASLRTTTAHSGTL